jgi:hypothetical protein
MAGEFQFSFTFKEIEALIRALEQCGVNRGSHQSMLEHFRDPELFNAAKAAHDLLRRNGQKQARPVNTTMAQELNPDAVIGELRDKLRRERQEHAEVLSRAADLLSALHRVQGILRRKLHAQADDSDRAAIAQLDESVDRLRWSVSDLAARLDAIQSAGRGGGA